jgi:hypothetical protein
MSTSTLQEFERDLLALVGDANDGGPYWSDSILEESLRSALRWFATSGPEIEASFTVTSAGYEQDMSALDPVPYIFYSLTYPWADGQSIDDGWQHYRFIGNSTVRVDNHSFAVGDVIRVRYAPVYTIENLDGEAATNLRTSDIPRFLLVAAHMLFFELATKAGISGDENYNRFRQLSDMFLEKFNMEYGGPEYIEWGSYA